MVDPKIGHADRARPGGTRIQTSASLTPGAAFSLMSAAPLCSDLPRPGVLVQSAENSLTLLNVNGVDLAINGMALIQAHDDFSLTVNALARETISARRERSFCGLQRPGLRGGRFRRGALRSGRCRKSAHRNLARRST
jgi:hypothetical protein